MSCFLAIRGFLILIEEIFEKKRILFTFIKAKVTYFQPELLVMALFSSNVGSIVVYVCCRLPRQFSVSRDEV